MSGSILFSSGRDSPVNEDWLRKKSFADRMRMSAGMIEPAASTMISPGAISSILICIWAPSRMTMAVDWTIFRSERTAASDRFS